MPPIEPLLNGFAIHGCTRAVCNLLKSNDSTVRCSRAPLFEKLGILKFIYDLKPKEKR